MSIRDQSRALVKGSIIWTVAAAAIASTLAFVVLRDLTFAWSVALGALVILVNFTAMTITLARSMGAPDLVLEDGTPKRRIRFGAALRWPLFMVALVWILWYMPARPQGLVLGVVIGLAGAAIAALRAKRTPHESPS